MTSDAPPWRAAALAHQRPHRWRSIWQIMSSFTPYVLLWCLMLLSLAQSFWLALALAPLAGGFLVRIFIILHDCGHGSFFVSRRANAILGSICGVLTFTPFYQWRHDHAMHHATSGDLDRRGYGDVPMATVAEYRAMTRWARLQYRIFRHPISMLIGGPIYSFLVVQRFVLPTSGARERRSVTLTNVALLAIILIAWQTIGLASYLLVQLPIVFFAGSAAVWMFYCQHQFEGAYWRSHDEWDYEAAAIHGSSYFRLPAVLQWFTGNIGFHHVHHYSPRIPNYFLEQVHQSHPRFQEVTTITIRSSLRAFALKLWDEDRAQLVALRDVDLEAPGAPSTGPRARVEP